MSKIITLSADPNTIKEFGEMSKQLNKTKSAFFREMVKYFVKHKEKLTSGLIIEGKQKEVKKEPQPPNWRDRLE